MADAPQVEHERHRLHAENQAVLSELKADLRDLKRHIIGTIGEPHTSVLWRMKRMEDMHQELMGKFNELLAAQASEKKDRERSRWMKRGIEAFKAVGYAAVGAFGGKHIP